VAEYGEKYVVGSVEMRL